MQLLLSLGRSEGWSVKLITEKLCYERNMHRGNIWLHTQR